MEGLFFFLSSLPPARLGGVLRLCHPHGRPPGAGAGVGAGVRGAAVGDVLVRSRFTRSCGDPGAPAARFGE